MIVLQVEGDRESVERQVLASLWGQKSVRLTADVVDGRFIVSMHSVDGEPSNDRADATPRAA